MFEHAWIRDQTQERKQGIVPIDVEIGGAALLALSR
jgi:hypothetical protein